VGLDFILRELIERYEVGLCLQYGGKSECQFAVSCGGYLVPETNVMMREQMPFLVKDYEAI